MLFSGPVIYLFYFTFFQITDNDFAPCGPSIIGNLELFLCKLAMYTSFWQGTCVLIKLYDMY